MVMFYLGSSVLFGLAAILIRGTSPFSPVGSSTYERKKKRWVMGMILLIGAAFALGIGVLAQLASS